MNCKIDKIYFTEKRNRPYAVLCSKDGVYGWTQYKSWRERIKHGEKEGELMVPLDIFYEFCTLNEKNGYDFSTTEIVETETSISQYYVFYDNVKDNYAVKLTDKFIEAFNERGCTLTRYEICCGSFKESGFYDYEMSYRLIERDWGNNYCENITNEEAKIITKVLNANCSLYNDILLYLETKELSDEEVDEIIKDVANFEKVVSGEIEKYRSELEAYSTTLPAVGLDCGFTLVYTRDEKMQAKYKTLYSLEKRSGQDVQVDFPDDYMSCSKSYNILEKLKELSGNPFVATLYVKTILD